MLKFKKDRNLWLKWLYEAKKRFGVVEDSYLIKEPVASYRVLFEGKTYP